MLNNYILKPDVKFTSVKYCRFEVQPSVGQQHTPSYRNWNPPLLGNLPDDFLRILPQQSDSIQVQN